MDVGTLIEIIRISFVLVFPLATLTLFFHELGHYLVAKYYGFFKGFGLVRGGKYIIPMPCVIPNIKKPPQIFYLTGLVVSWFAFPFVYLFNFYLSFNTYLKIFVIITILYSLSDFEKMIFYDKLVEKEDDLIYICLPKLK